MPRKRLTTRRLVASPDAFSGQNFNSPVMLYDTHPNKRFVVGEDVIPVTGSSNRGMPVRGQVIGHSAEDRLWVKWPTEIAQEDVSDVMAFREYEYGGTTRDRLKGPQASRAASRQAHGELLVDEGSSDDETEEVQEVLFATLPEDQDPEEDFDVEPEGSDEVTIIDMGSVCDDEYDQTSVIEEALQDSDIESLEGESERPFLTGSRTAVGFWEGVNKAFAQPVNKAEYGVNKLFNTKLWSRELNPTHHRFLVVVNKNQGQIAYVNAANPQDAIKQAVADGYSVVGDATLRNDETAAQYNKRNQYNKSNKVNYNPYQLIVVVQGPNTNAYVDAKTEEEAVKYIKGKGFNIVQVRGIMESGSQAKPLKQKTQQKTQPSTFSGVSKNPKRPKGYTGQTPGPEMVRKLNRKWRVTGVYGSGKKINNRTFSATTEEDARRQLADAGVKTIYELEVYDSQTGDWVEPSQLSKEPESDSTLQRTTEPAQTQKTPSKSWREVWKESWQQKAASLEQQADAIRDSLNMTHTADLVRQAARVALAVQEVVQTDDDLDAVVTIAVKQASQDILTAADYLRRTNHITAHRIASRIEQDFVDSLSFRIGA